MPVFALFVGAIACLFFGVGFLAGCVWAGSVRAEDLDELVAQRERLRGTLGAVDPPVAAQVLPWRPRLYDWEREGA